MGAPSLHTGRTHHAETSSVRLLQQFQQVHTGAVAKPTRADSVSSCVVVRRQRFCALLGTKSARASGVESKQWEEDGEDQHVSERVCVRERIDGVRGGSVHIEMTPRRCAAV